MPSTPKAKWTPKPLIHVQLPWYWNRAALGAGVELGRSSTTT